MVILLALVLGVLAGATVCAKYLRREIAADMASIAPRLRNIERQLTTMQAELNLNSDLRLAAISKRIDQGRSDS